MPRVDSDLAITRAFTENGQNTHKAVVSNSVGMALLQLEKNYFKSTDTEADIEKKYQHCIQELERQAKGKRDRESAVNFLKGRAQDNVNQHDELNLFLPDGNSYKSQIHTFHLPRVITLVWLALNDHEKFAHAFNYSGTPQQQFNRARGECNFRLDNFFKLLTGLQKNLICHQGIRNELVFLLNKIYLGIEIIEDERSTIAAILKDHINDLFWKNYQIAETTVKKTLTTALFTWISDYNPLPLLVLVDPANTGTKILTTLFIKHGSDPDYIKLDNLIAECLPALSFAYDPARYPVIKMVESVFNSNHDADSEELKCAFTNVSHWIRSHLTLDDPDTTEKLTVFYTLYQAYSIFDSRLEMLLKATNDYLPSFNEFKATCAKYLVSIAKANLADDFPLADSDSLQIAEQLKLSIARCKSDKMAPFIENFFANWNLDNDPHHGAERKHLYRFLLDNEFHDKVMFKDEEIDAFMRQSSEIPSPFHDITVYQINRIFLHAFVTEPSNWTKKYADLLAAVKDFVRNRFNSVESNNHNHNLFLTSYPGTLLENLNLLHAEFLSSIPAILTSYLLLPHHVTNITQWGYIQKIVDNEKFQELYESRAVKINKFIRQALMDDKVRAIVPLDSMIGHIPRRYRTAFVLHDDMINLLGKFLTDADESLSDEVLGIFSLFPREERLSIWQSIPESFRNDLSNYVPNKWWIRALNFLNKSERLEFIRLFPKRQFNVSIMLLFPSDYLLKHTKAQPMERLVNLLKNNFQKLMEKLDFQQRLELITFIDESLPNMENKIKFLRDIGALNEGIVTENSFSDRDNWLNAFDIMRYEKHFISLMLYGRQNFLTLFPTAEYLRKLLSTLSNDEFYHFAQDTMIITYLNNHILPGAGILLNFLEKVPENKRLNLLLKWDPEYKIIPSLIILKDIIALLPNAERFCYLETIFNLLFYSSLSQNVREPNIYSVLKLLIAQDQTRAFKLIGGDTFTNLIATMPPNPYKLGDIQSLVLINRPVETARFNREFVQTFIKIYLALRAAQTTFLKSNYVDNYQLMDISPELGVKVIIAHAIAQPNSRTADALALMKKYSCYDSSNTKLLSDIYSKGFSKSGFFKRSSDTSGTFTYSAKTLENKPLESIWKRDSSSSAFNNPNSRRNKILNIFAQKANVNQAANAVQEHEPQGLLR